MHIDPDSHDTAIAALAAADPAAGIDLDPDTAHRILSATLHAQTQPAARKRTMTVAAAGIAGVLAIAAATPAVADGIGYVAQTGMFGPAGGENPDNSEWIEITAPDFVEYAVTLYPDYARLPAGYDRARFAELVAERRVEVNNGERGIMQAIGIVEMYESRARCAWQVEWLDANTDGDAKRQTAAAAMLTEAATWPKTVASDGGGYVEAEQALARAAQAGDRSTVAHAVTDYCSSLAEEARR
jgi:hypothetical protein